MPETPEVAEREVPKGMSGLIVPQEPDSMRQTYGAFTLVGQSHQTVWTISGAVDHRTMSGPSVDHLRTSGRPFVDHEWTLCGPSVDHPWTIRP